MNGSIFDRSNFVAEGTYGFCLRLESSSTEGLGWKESRERFIK